MKIVIEINGLGLAAPKRGTVVADYIDGVARQATYGNVRGEVALADPAMPLAHWHIEEDD